MTFAEKLKELRTAAGLTQQQLADRSGRGLGTIRDYEQGKKEPVLSAAFRLADALGVSIEVFAGCERGKDDALPAKLGRPPKQDPALVKALPPTEPKKPQRGRPRKGGA